MGNLLKRVGWFVVVVSCSIGAVERASVYRFEDEAHANFLKVEFVSDAIVHFELGTLKKENKSFEKVIWHSPMLVEQLNFENVTVIQPNPYTLKTSRLTVFVNPASLCIHASDNTSGNILTTLCPQNLDQDWKSLINFSMYDKNVYGLGQYFINTGSADGDWMGHVWDPGDYQGNSMRPFEGGANGYSQIPIAYFLDDNQGAYGFFLDSIYRQKWDFSKKPWKIDTYGDQIRFFVIAGNSLKDIRHRYMGLVGRPPIPPKSAFGLWVSQFGYTGWDELLGELFTLREHHFPVDGFALDLQWFGGKFYPNGTDAQESRMGTLAFDESHFQKPKETVQWLKNSHGVELMPIEESYISHSLFEHHLLQERGLLARHCDSENPIFLTANPWWGVGGMIDWSNEAAGRYWHDIKRQKLVDMGMHFHWTDLGEPEMYDSNACYFGIPELLLFHHQDIHNLYNLMWSKSIYEGYRRHHEELRPFILSRSGTAGSQRYGVAFWSGDIAANMRALKAHERSQMHMSLSGIDYYGSDIGGFHRSAYTVDGDVNELYTQWFANSALFDFPVRPHVWNIEKNNQSSPVKIGDEESNRANIFLRYALLPYYYSLAYAAHTQGDPLVAPMVYYFQNNRDLRQMGHQKMIGPYLMAGMVARYGEKKRPMYFPQGEWYNFHTHELYKGKNAYEEGISIFYKGKLMLPLFARRGAIIPMQPVDESMRNINGFREDKSKNIFQGTLVRFYPDHKTSYFDLYEDDGNTTAYEEGEYGVTHLYGQEKQEEIEFAAEPKQGNYEKDNTRDWRVSIYLGDKNAKAVFLNQKPIGLCTEAAEKNCFEWESPFMEIRTASLQDGEMKEIRVKF